MSGKKIQVIEKIKVCGAEVGELCCAGREEGDALRRLTGEERRGFFPFTPAGDRAVFCKARKNALLPSKKRGGFELYPENWTAKKSPGAVHQERFNKWHRR